MTKALKTGTLETGAVESGAIETGTLESGTLESGTLESGAVGTGAVETGTIESGAIESGAIESGAIESGAIDAGTLDTGTLDIGLGARAALAEPARGRVLAVYRKAVYLRLPAGLCALTNASAPSGPLHLRRAVLPRCQPGDRVRTDGRLLNGDDWSIPLAAPTWVGRLPPRHQLSSAVPPGRVSELAGSLAGRGPGLTPAGDDVLAGLLLVARASGGPAVEPPLLALAGRVRSTAIALGFLAWAARGQCIAPAHEALASLARHGADAHTPACDRLTSIGASSGAALLLGLRIGLGVTGTAVDLSTIVEFHSLS